MTSAPTPDDAPDAELTTGTVRGAAHDGIRRFLGIPYAKPPVGPLRFAAPEPVDAWDGVRDATRFGDAVPQSPYPGAISAILSSVEQWGDDGLSVNVWAPDAASGAPVVVWVHGGALERGSSALAGYDGTAFARDGVVFVSINYRLGSEGFSVFPDGPRNLGLRDAALALEWVHREIAAFGGDPSRITLMGESAGGSIVAALLSRPQTAGLVRGGIIQSGPLEAPEPEKAAAVTRTLAKHLDVPATRAAFRDIPPERLLAARADLAGGASPLGRNPSFALTIDPATLPVSPHEALVDLDVPVLIGTNTDEYRLWFPPSALARIGALKARLAQAALRIPRRAARALREAMPDASRGEVLGQLLTDKILRAPATGVARTRTAPTWMYEFAWHSPVRDLRAAHAVEIPFVFDRTDTDAGRMLAGPAAPATLATEMHEAWVRFITDGDPGWEAYRPGRVTRLFDVESHTVPQRRAKVVAALGARV